MRALVLLLLPLAACGPSFLSARAKAEKVCVRQLDTRIAGAAPAAAGPLAAVGGLDAFTGTLDDVIELDVADLSEVRAEAAAANVDLQSFRLTAPPGTLAGVDELFIRVTPPPGSSLPPITLVDYVAGRPDAEQGGLLRIEGDVVSVDLAAAGVDLVDYLETDQLTLELHATGDLPATEWSATVETCVALDAEYDYGKDLGL
jgi:hypothetical protein